MNKLLMVMIVAIPFHIAATILLARQWFNESASGFLAVCAKVMGLIFSLPLLYPLMQYDPDGDRLPEWLQTVSVPLNSILWLGLVYGLVWAFRSLALGKRHGAQG